MTNTLAAALDRVLLFSEKEARATRCGRRCRLPDGTRQPERGFELRTSGRDSDSPFGRCQLGWRRFASGLR